MLFSLACTAIELLTGAPPYAQLTPMAAIFRMVQDDHPPLPLGCSAALEDFLLSSFEKDPTQRPSAQQLQSHPWIIECSQLAGTPDLGTARTSIRQYARRPTIVMAQIPSLEDINKGSKEREKQEIEQMKKALEKVSLVTELDEVI